MKAVIDDKQYYLISNQASSTDGVLGWMKASDLKTHEHKGVDTQAKTFSLNGKGNAFTKAWGKDGNLVFNLPSYADAEFRVNKTEQVGNNTWYRGTLDDQRVFIHEAYVN